MVHLRRSTAAGHSKRVVIFPSGAGKGDSHDLRAEALVPELHRLGWRAVFAPCQLSLSQRRRILRWERPDVIYFQQSRLDLNDPTLYPETPCVLDADDADILDPRCHDFVVRCVAKCESVIAGSRFLEQQFLPHNPRVSVIWTGGYIRPSYPEAGLKTRDPIVAWAHSNPLSYPIEAEMVRKIILGLAGMRPFTFSLYGLQDPDSPAVRDYLSPIRERGVNVVTHRTMPYLEFINSLHSAAIGLHPVCLDNPFSNGKSFGKLLAYMAAGVAVVTTNAVDHPLFYRDGANGFLIDNDINLWVERCEQLLAHPEERASMAKAAAADYQDRLSTAQAARRVCAHLDGVLARTR